MKVLIIGYYHLADGFKAFSDTLDPDIVVDFFPLLHYRTNSIDPSDDLSYKLSGVTHVLYWNNFLDRAILSKIKNISDGIKTIRYNWDPHLPSDHSEYYQLMEKNLDLFDLIITVNPVEKKYWQSKGHRVDFCGSGFNPKITYPMPSDPIADVSIVCTNLYDKIPLEHVRFSRKKLVDLLYQCPEINFKIYGPEKFRSEYPRAYSGYVNYQDCPKVFSNSKINLCLHAYSYLSDRDTGEEYYSERLPQILGCKGLMLSETEYTFIKPGVHYVLLDVSDPIGQIKGILNNYADLDQIRENGYQYSLEHLTWKNLVKMIKLS